MFTISQYVYGYEMLMTGFDLAAGVDRLNTKNVANFDWLLWRMQLQELAVLEEPAILSSTISITDFNEAETAGSAEGMNGAVLSDVELANETVSTVGWSDEDAMRAERHQE